MYPPFLVVVVLAEEGSLRAVLPLTPEAANVDILSPDSRSSRWCVPPTVKARPTYQTHTIK